MSECSICFEYIKHPFILKCGHGFHKHCINKWIDKCNDTYCKCPNCRYSILKIYTDKQLYEKLERKVNYEFEQSIDYLFDYYINFIHSKFFFMLIHDLIIMEKNLNKIQKISDLTGYSIPIAIDYLVDITNLYYDYDKDLLAGLLHLYFLYTLYIFYYLFSHYHYRGHHCTSFLTRHSRYQNKNN